MNPSNVKVAVPLSVFGNTFFVENYARVGRFAHAWCHAVWKRDPVFVAWPGEDDLVSEAVRHGWLTREDDVLWLTGPNRDPLWLRGGERPWLTYAIEAIGQNAVKVGRAVDVPRRLNHLQTACPHRLRVIGSVERDIESRLHTQLREAGAEISGEWFRLDYSHGILFAAGLMSSPPPPVPR